ncbi:MAG: MFS transporter [Trueperaceae bacterium]
MRRNAARAFGLLAFINLLVGGMVGLERTVVPVLGTEVFLLPQGAALAAFVITFGISKAVFNLFAGVLADRIGRKKVLLVGWAIGLPVPLLIMGAPSWGWIIVANVLLGVNQAMTWSMTLNMMVDLVPVRRRGFAAGVNEFAGYLGVSLLAFLTGLVAAAYGLRPEPFYLGIAVSILGLLASAFVPETAPAGRAPALRWVRGVGAPSLLGAATNLKDGLVWLALPLVMTARGFDLVEVGLVAGLYPFVWASGQVVFGPLSDRVGRKRLVLGGVALQGVGLVLVGLTLPLAALLAAAVILGLGTSMAYPTLIAMVADRAPAPERATALGIYRFFRDSGYALGAIVAATFAAILTNTIVITGAAMLLAAIVMTRTLQEPVPSTPPGAGAVEASSGT